MPPLNISEPVCRESFTAWRMDSIKVEDLINIEFGELVFSYIPLQMIIVPLRLVLMDFLHCLVCLP